VVRDPLHVWAMKNRRRVDSGDEKLWIAPPEYVLLRKLEFFREGRQDKHIEDMRFMLAVTKMDQRFTTVQVERLGLLDQWNELLEAYRATGGENLD
jgi:hypothetical protein